jgi:two-component system sensor histidine kinase VicK
MSKGILNKLRLHTKFIVLLTGVSLVPLIIVAGVTQVRFQQTLQTDASKLGHQLAATASAEIKSFIVSQLRILDNIAALYQPEFPIEDEIAAQLLENILFRSENFYDITVVNEAGQEIARKNRRLALTDTEARDLADFEGFAQVRESGIYVGPIEIESGRPFFVFGLQIRDQKGEFAGAVFAEVDARIMPRVVSEISDSLGAGGRVYMVNEEGLVIGHRDLSYVLAQKDLSALPPVRQVVERSTFLESSAEYTNELGVEVLGSAHPLRVELLDAQAQSTPNISWYVVAEQPLAVVYAEARRAALFAVALSLAAVLLAVLAAVLVAGRISRPIESLHSAAQEFGKGNLGYRAHIESGDEIGDLASSFNTMAETIGRAMQSLRQEEGVVRAERNKLSLILAGITNAVIAVDLDGRIVLFNKAAEALVGLAETKVVGKKVGEVIRIFDETSEVPASEYCPTVTDSYGMVFNKMNLRMPVAEGKERVVNLVSGRIQEGLSIQLGCVLTFQDITHEYAVEKMKREFLTIAAHQLRTPLTALKWAVGYLAAGEKGALNPEQNTLASHALDSVNRMIHLVDDLLDVSHVEEGKFTIHPSKQSIVPLFERIAETFKRSADLKGVMLSIMLQKDLPQFSFDADKIEIVLNNLFDNAIKYTPRGGRVEAHAEIRGEAFVCSIQDSGIGIPHADTERIFTKFFRSSQAYLHHTDGSGIGLYVAKNIMDQHGGKIWFDSVEGKGTTFHVSLPLEAHAA